MRFFITRERYLKLGHIEKAKRTLKIIDEVYLTAAACMVEIQPEAAITLDIVVELARIIKDTDGMGNTHSILSAHHALNTTFNLLEIAQRETISLVNMRQRSQ